MKSTMEMENEIVAAKTIDEVDALFTADNQTPRFCDYLAELMDTKGIKRKQIEENISLATSTVYNYKSGKNLPKSKEEIIKIAIAIKATRTETDRLLKLAGFKELYAKDENDAYIIFGIQEGLSVAEIDHLLEERGLKYRLVRETDKL